MLSRLLAANPGNMQGGGLLGNNIDPQQYLMMAQQNNPIDINQMAQSFDPNTLQMSPQQTDPIAMSMLQALQKRPSLRKHMSKYSQKLSPSHVKY